MNTQEPHPKARPTLSEGQRRVLEHMGQGALAHVVYATRKRFGYKVAWLELSDVEIEVADCEGLYEAGLVAKLRGVDESAELVVLEITPAGRAALSHDTDTDTDTGKQGRGGEEL